MENARPGGVSRFILPAFSRQRAQALAFYLLSYTLRSPQKGSLHPSLYLALFPPVAPVCHLPEPGQVFEESCLVLTALSQNYLFSQANL